MALSIWLLGCAAFIILTWMGTPFYMVESPPAEEVVQLMLPVEGEGPVREMPWEQLQLGEWDTRRDVTNGAADSQASWEMRKLIDDLREPYRRGARHGDRGGRGEGQGRSRGRRGPGQQPDWPAWRLRQDDRRGLAAWPEEGHHARVVDPGRRRGANPSRRPSTSTTTPITTNGSAYEQHHVENHRRHPRLLGDRRRVSVGVLHGHVPRRHTHGRCKRRTGPAEPSKTAPCSIEANCIGCHGVQGQGIPGVAPALNSEAFFTTRLKEVGYTGSLRSFIESTVNAGRPVGSGQYSAKMPTWGQAYGGPLRPDQVRDVASFILNWEATAVAAGQAVTGTQATPTPAAVVSGDPIDIGKAAYAAKGCAGCHGEPGGAGGGIGPNLGGIATRAGSTVAGQSAEEYIHTSIVNPNAYIVPECPTGACAAGPHAAELRPDVVAGRAGWPGAVPADAGIARASTIAICLTATPGRAGSAGPARVPRGGAPL